MVRENIIKKIKYIILILISLFILSSCDKKNDNKEIKYTLSENIELGECDEFSETFTIPSHQYVHITFTKNSNWCVYEISMWSYYYLRNLKNRELGVYSQTNLREEDTTIGHKRLYDGYDMYLENGEYYINIYNHYDEEKEYGCSLKNSKKDIYYEYIVNDIQGSDYISPYLSIIYNGEEYKLKIDNHLETEIIELTIDRYHYGEKYKINFNGDDSLSMKVFDSYGNEVGTEITRDADDNNYVYYICVYKSINTDEAGNYTLSVDYEDIYDGMEVTILENSTYLDRRNYYTYYCNESGNYRISSNNTNVSAKIKTSDFETLIQDENGCIYLEKNNKYYVSIWNADSENINTATINIKKDV